jgi:hypothetical protein
LFRWLPIITSWRKFWSDDCRSWPREEKINISDNDYWGICLFHVVWTNFFLQLFLCGTCTHRIYIFVFINWTMSDNLPERVQILGHTHIICINVLENRIICCQIFCNLLLKSTFEQIFNVMQLILVKIKWHTFCIKWKYLIQKSTIFAFHITLNEPFDYFIWHTCLMLV